MAGTEELLAQLEGTTKAEDITRADRLKVAICGARGTGKSFMVAHTARKPLLHYDFDDRRESIAGAKDTIIKTLVDVDPLYPKAWSELDSDMSTLEYLARKDVQGNSKIGIKSLCFDSGTFLRKFAENQLMKDTNMRRVYKINGKEMPIAQGWDAITGVRNMMYNMFRRSFALGVDVYLICHLVAEKDKTKTERITNDKGQTTEVAAYTGKWVIEPQYMDEVLSIFNEVYRAFIDASGDFRLQVKPDEFFHAKTSFFKDVDMIMPADIQGLLVKCGG